MSHGALLCLQQRSCTHAVYASRCQVVGSSWLCLQGSTLPTHRAWSAGACYAGLVCLLAHAVHTGLLAGLTWVICACCACKCKAAGWSPWRTLFLSLLIT